MPNAREGFSLLCGVCKTETPRETQARMKKTWEEMATRCCKVCKHAHDGLVLQCVQQGGMSVPAKGFCEKFERKPNAHPHGTAAFAGTVRRFVGWLRRIFKRPQYVMGWDLGEDRDYWVKSRLNPDGTIEIIDHGRNEHKPPNAGSHRQEEG